MLPGLIVWKNKQLLYTVSTEVVVDCPMKFRSEEHYYYEDNLFCQLIYLPFASHKRFKQNSSGLASSLSHHYLCLCSLFIHKISILIQNMMKICKACNKPFSLLISQFHTSEEIVETILHFITNINIYKHFRKISPMFCKILAFCFYSVDIRWIIKAAGSWLGVTSTITHK